MLTLFLLYSVILLILPSNILHYIILCFMMYIYYLSNLNMFFNSSLSVNSEFFINDEMSLFMTFLLFFIMFISYLLGNMFKSNKLMGFVLLSLTFFCFQVFNTTHLFSLYFFYEASLIPIFYIIIKWGSYPERSISVLMMISYTLVFGVPLFIIIMSIYNSVFSWYIPFMSHFQVSFLCSLMIFLCFAVKLPIYGIHYWLPMAHVEAPTFGSVILASILLKLGGVGLYRLIPLMDMESMKSFVLSYFIIFTLYSTVVCCFQSDFKRLIAYSSVAHMMVVPFLIFSNNLLSIQSLIMIMLFHGLSSTLMFMSVGVLYLMFSSRQLILMRGLVLISPLMSMILVLTFFYTLSAPPFPSFIAEVYFMMSSYILSSYMVYMMIPFVLLGLVYNLNWMSSILFSSSPDSCYNSTHLNYSMVYMFMLIGLFTICIMFLFTFF